MHWAYEACVCTSGIRGMCVRTFAGAASADGAASLGVAVALILQVRQLLCCRFGWYNCTDKGIKLLQLFEAFMSKLSRISSSPAGWFAFLTTVLYLTHTWDRLLSLSLQTAYPPHALCKIVVQRNRSTITPKYLWNECTHFLLRRHLRELRFWKQAFDCGSTLLLHILPCVVCILANQRESYCGRTQNIDLSHSLSEKIDFHVPRQLCRMSPDIFAAEMGYKFAAARQSGESSDAYWMLQILMSSEHLV